MVRTIVAQTRLSWGLIVLTAALTMAGCGRSSATVSGKVYYKDTLVKGGNVTFHGDDKWTGTSFIKEDGSYSIPKVPKGKVRITVDTLTVKPNPNMSRMGKIPADANLPPGSFYDTAKRTELYVEIPPNYADKDRSTLDYEVKSGKQTHDIKME